MHVLFHLYPALVEISEKNRSRVGTNVTGHRPQLMSLLSVQFHACPGKLGEESGAVECQVGWLGLKYDRFCFCFFARITHTP